MANWVRFSERMPTEGDLDNGGQVVIQGEDGTLATAWIPHHRRRDASGPPDHYKDCCWLESLPPLPEPRTLEDVARDMIGCDGIPITKPCAYVVHYALIEEMKEILERKDDERT